MELVIMSLMLLVGAKAQQGGLISSLGASPLSGISITSRNPCRPSPCGPNTSCSVTGKGFAQCRCLGDFVPDGHTIIGCKPQCTRDNDCPYDYRCQGTMCSRVCQSGSCGPNAECIARNHRAICECPEGYHGLSCLLIVTTPPPVVNTPVFRDLCHPNPCGQNAECRPRSDRAVCTCPIGYEGDPLTNCIRGECIEANHCPGNMTCQKLRCIDPCNIPNICGRNAECQTINHQPICSCGLGLAGDPFIICKPDIDLCRPSPCGFNTNCKVRNDRAVCSCIENYIGNPLTACRPECISDTECPSRMACENNKCVNPCINACGEGAICDVIQGRAKCSCPEFYQGSPRSRCYPECTAHIDCPHDQACLQLQCVDPCEAEGFCGVGAECKVENHKLHCSCSKGYTGNPFESCQLANLCRPNPCGIGGDCTHGSDRYGNDRPVCSCPAGFRGDPLISCTRGECEIHDECRDHQACYDYTCKNPCYTNLGGSVCGNNAECNVKNHQPVCSCPRGYYGNPLQACYRRSTRLSRGESDEKE